MLWSVGLPSELTSKRANSASIRRVFSAGVSAGRVAFGASKSIAPVGRTPSPTEEDLGRRRPFVASGGPVGVVPFELVVARGGEPDRSKGRGEYRAGSSQAWRGEVERAVSGGGIGALGRGGRASMKDETGRWFIAGREGGEVDMCDEKGGREWD